MAERKICGQDHTHTHGSTSQNLPSFYYCMCVFACVHLRDESLDAFLWKQTRKIEAEGCITRRRGVTKAKWVEVNRGQ